MYGFEGDEPGFPYRRDRDRRTERRLVVTPNLLGSLPSCSAHPNRIRGAAFDISGPQVL
jgi:hypothetical protein